VAEDLGPECLGCYGGTSYNTANLDALAASGTRFRYCFATPLGPPSRAELLTGRYGFRTGWTSALGRSQENDQFLDPAKETTIGAVLRRSGYATAVAGAWQLCQFEAHPDHPRQCGFEQFCCWSWTIKAEKTSRYWNPSVWQDGRLRTDLRGQFGEDVFCQSLIDFIRRNRSRPFFVYYPTVLVHEPFIVPPDIKAGPADRESRKENKETHRFSGMVAYLDRLVGRLVTTVEELGLREETVIVFTSDCGTDRRITSLQNGVNVRGDKGMMSDRATRVPLLASWKGTTPAGRVCDDLIDFSDFLPTLAELSAAETPRHVTFDGLSFAPQLRGQQGKVRPWVFSGLKDAWLVRDHRWELLDDGRFFDLLNDPLAKHNLPKGSGPDADAARARLEAVFDSLE
jgi:arylsulfatase A-like enzyme